MRGRRGRIELATGGPAGSRRPLAPRLAHEVQPVADDMPWPGGGREVVALAPLALVPWAVDGAAGGRRGVRRGVRRRGAGCSPWGPLVIGFALLFAWGAAQSVRLAARACSAGRRGASPRATSRGPCRRCPRDEIGELGESFERMRGQLAESMDRITRHAQELEERVAARTRDLRRHIDALEAHNEQRGRLLRKVISAQEEERKRLARELHDETCQKVAALGIRIDTALAADSIDDMRDRLGDARALASKTLEDIHRVIFDLRPSVLDDLGLLSAIRWYAHAAARAERTSRCATISPSARSRSRPRPRRRCSAPSRKRSTTSRATPRAENALIEIDTPPGELRIEIEDDGAGFDVAERDQRRASRAAASASSASASAWSCSAAPWRSTRHRATAPREVHGAARGRGEPLNAECAMRNAANAERASADGGRRGTHSPTTLRHRRIDGAATARAFRTRAEFRSRTRTGPS